MPWQQYVANVALEVDEATGELAYRQVVLTVPRQSGKTTLLLAIMVLRAIKFTDVVGKRQNIVYTAQDRLSARKKWTDEHCMSLLLAQKRYPEHYKFRIRKQLGEEAIIYENGSMHGLTAPSPRAVHGEFLDLGVIDEAFARRDDSVEQGMKPAMVTRDVPQIWIVSTAGDRTSTYLRKKVEAGRQLVELGINSGVAYFEWSAEPEADPGAEATWYGCMPALGRTAKVEAVRSDFQTMELDEFRRAYLNQWSEDALDDWDVIPKKVWEGLAKPQVSKPERFAWALDGTPDRQWSSIGAAGMVSGGYVVDSVDHQRGTDWLIPRIEQMIRKIVEREDDLPCAIVVAPSGPLKNVVPELEVKLAGLIEELNLKFDLEIEEIPILKPNLNDIAGSCIHFLELTGAVPEVPYANLCHRDQVELNVAVAGAEKREYTDYWLLARKGPSTDVSPLIAVVLALWGFQQKGHVADSLEDDEPWVMS
jgi:hypothetical protein